MNFDEMDIEPKSEPPVVRKTPPQSSDSFSKIEKVNDDELQSQLLLRTVSLDDGNIGYVFTCTKNGPLATWRCHVCNFVDTWKNLIKHLETKWHHDSISKYRHSRSNFSKVENAIPDISKGQPLPPGMEEEIAGPCQILKSLQTYDHPLIGLEFLLEMHIVDLKEPRYLCLLCDKRGDPRSILVHLTSQNHYLMYLRKYFRKFYALIDKLPKSNECRGNVSTVTSHLIGKLEEKYGRLQPTATREDVINVPEQRSIILQKIDNSVHFSESAEDSYLEDMLTIEYVQSPHLLLKNFPLKPKQINTEKPREDSKSSRNASKKHIRSRDSDSFGRDNSPDILYVGSAKNSHSRNDRSRERSPLGHSRPRSRSHHRSRTPDRGRRRYVSPTFYRSSRYRLSRSRSPRRNRSRSPLLDRDRFYRRSMTPLSITSRGRERSPFPPSRYSYRYRSPERDSRRIHHRSPSPVRNDDHLRYRGRSRSRELRSRDRSPFYRPRRSRSRSRPRHNSEIRSNSRSSMVISDPPKVREKERTEVNTSRAYIREAKEMEERLNKDMDRFTETPESHPAYQDEWKKFWCAKFKEIQSKGKEDPHKYDYKPEWIIFWNKRVKELFDSEMKTRIKALKTKYGISGEEKLVKEPREEKKEEKKVKSICSDDDEKRPVIDIKTMWKELTGCEIKDEPAKRKSPSPWEEDNDDTNSDKEGSTKGASKKRSNNVLDEGCTTPISPEPLSSISDAESPRRSPMRRSRSPSRSRSRSRSAPRSFSKEYPFKDEYRKPATKKIHFENPLNIITVLRQLSVLEFQLGSYASHVVTLLTSGLTMERIKPQSSVELLTKENILFLELVKEKLKGQLLAGVVPKSMVKATLFCIKNIEELLLLVPKLKPSVPPPIPAPPPALLYGAGVDSIGGHVPSASGSHQFGHHVYGHYPHPTAGGYKPMPPAFKHYDRSGGIGDKYKERFPFRKTSPKRHDDGGRGPAIDKVRRPSDEFPFRNNEPVTAEPLKEKPVAAAPVEEEVTIDKNLIALQIAEVLTQQGRSDVSNEELQALINTVVENLKQEQRMKALQKDSAPLKELNIPAAVNAVTAPGANVAANSTFNVPTIPAGFNLNDVSSTTLALLQDAYVNASVLSAAKPFAIDDLTEAELIQMLRNFKNIPRVKQEKLIEFLRKLEVTNPDRVEELKKYVNVL